jgi:hypothetical protein
METQGLLSELLKLMEWVSYRFLQLFYNGSLSRLKIYELVSAWLPEVLKERYSYLALEL